MTTNYVLKERNEHEDTFDIFWDKGWTNHALIRKERNQQNKNVIGFTVLQCENNKLPEHVLSFLNFKFKVVRK